MNELFQKPSKENLRYKSTLSESRSATGFAFQPELGLRKKMIASGTPEFKIQPQFHTPRENVEIEPGTPRFKIQPQFDSRREDSRLKKGTDSGTRLITHIENFKRKYYNIFY